MEERATWCSLVSCTQSKNEIKTINWLHCRTTGQLPARRVSSSIRPCISWCSQSFAAGFNTGNEEPIQTRSHSQGIRTPTAFWFPLIFQKPVFPPKKLVSLLLRYRQAWDQSSLLGCTNNVSNGIFHSSQGTLLMLSRCNNLQPCANTRSASQQWELTNQDHP